MCLLIETIQIRDGEILLLPYHQNRLSHAFRKLYKSTGTIVISEFINIPQYAKQGVWKCRIIYNAAGIKEIIYTPYIYREIKSLQIIELPHITYDFKYHDRSIFEKLLLQKGTCDEILISKHGTITDTSYSNIIFYNGSDWITPQTYLLEGTQRKFLLETHQIKEDAISINHLHLFSKARIINCFNDLEHGFDINMKSIF